MTFSGKPSLFGRVAVKNNFITKDQLNAALVEQAGSNPKIQLGQIFVANGWMTEKEVDKLLDVQKQVLEKHSEKQGRTTRVTQEGVVIGKFDIPVAEQPAPVEKSSSFQRKKRRWRF
jgi:hypothetical protein